MVMHCAGSLIAPNKVLTAAHCVYLEVDGPADLDVVAGRGDRKSNAGKRVHVKSSWVPPKYDGNDNKFHDLAVLTLDEDLPYKPIEIAGADQKSLYAVGTKATVLGWGHTKEGGSQETNQEPSTVRYLHKAAVQVVKDGLCEAAYNKYDTQYRQDLMLCAARKAEGKGQGACPYDDGGPLIAGGYLIGVVSFGNYCELTGPPVAYTRIETYADVINSEVDSA
jgi:secreted trypsin-like serine protease